MIRHEEIINAANEYVTKIHSPSTNEFQTAMNIAVVKAYIAAAKWADETMIEKVCKYLKSNLFEINSKTTPNIMSVENITINDFIKNLYKAIKK